MKSNNIKRLIKLSRGELPTLMWGLFFLLISSITLLYYPQAIRNIIDEALATKNREQLDRAALIALAVFAVQSISSALRYYCFTLAGENSVKKLRASLFSKIITQHMEFFDKQKTGELIGRLSSDTTVLQNAMSVNISMLVRSSTQAIGAIVMLFLTSAQLSLFILVLIPPMGFLVASFGRKVKKISKATQDTLAQSMGIAEEGISGVRTVKAFAQEGYEQKRYQESLENSFLNSKHRIVEVTKFTSLVSLVGLSVVVFVIWYGGTLVVDGDLSVGTLTAFLMYVMTLAFSIGMLGSLWADFMSAFGASTRIFEILEIEPSENSKKLGQAEVVSGGIRFTDVDFAYPTRPESKVLNNISFDIAPLETVAIVGTSGGGKSTIVKLLMNFYEAQSGGILVADKAINEYSIKSLRRSIGLVAQEPILISESIAQNISYGKQGAGIKEIIDAAKIAFAHDFIESFPEGYDTLVGEKGVQLSGGQKQRVALARAIIKNPQILVLDEATSALDSQSESMVQQALDNLIGKRSTIIIAHRLSTVKKADRILVIDKGQIAQEGSHDELLKDVDGIYHGLVEHQFEL